uniref:Uncharacterized protein n=1 Tax=Romanomermis culicivorax TaxID=13658 RepID=A0A915KSM7_ROMCU
MESVSSFLSICVYATFYFVPIYDGAYHVFKYLTKSFFEPKTNRPTMSDPPGSIRKTCLACNKIDSSSNAKSLTAYKVRCDDDNTLFKENSFAFGPAPSVGKIFGFSLSKMLKNELSQR